MSIVDSRPLGLAFDAAVCMSEIAAVFLVLLDGARSTSRLVYRTSCTQLILSYDIMHPDYRNALR